MAETIQRPQEEKWVRSTEKRYERYVFAERYPDQIISVSQIRKERNVVLRDLTEDIRTNGLHNPIDVGIVSEAFMAEYLEFVRKTWGDSAKLEGLRSMRREDGTYTLLLAGHSRFQAILDIQDQEFLETGVFTTYPIPVKEHSIESVWDVIRIQLGENIHSTPPRERQAVALVEAYEYGLQHGQWKDMDEFLSTRDEEDVSRNFMKQAERFRRLTPELRSYVLSGPLDYSAGVELALTVQPLRKLFAAKMGIEGQPSDAQAATISELVNIELIILANRIVEEKMRTTAAQSMIKAWRKKWNDQYHMLLLDAEEEGSFELDLVVDDFASKHQRERREALKAQLARLAKLKGSDISTMLELASSTVEPGYVQECLDRQLADAERLVQARRALGAHARGASAVMEELAAS